MKKFSLGATLVLGFSVGLAITLVASGAIAALSLKHVANRWPGLNDLSRKAPWISGILIMVVGFYMLLHGWSHL
ncbi:nickel/cobalt efflux protein RcnA [Klebsiella michiganensis]|uniref:Nickel/cobalt efflux protein RcnA n=1 Tax=Klebsiella michiganensis TaxID=1134687 RepID=A0A7H4LYJ2_9ENTR|nr:nickel/cobalt efflux protein RcnA [Klebsiella michiganensis]